MRIVRSGKALRLVAGLFAWLASGLEAATAAEDAFYLGRWRIAAAVAAPWSGPELTPDLQQMAALKGQTLSIARDRIAGPRTLGCRGPHYRIVESTPDLLFQGELAEPMRYAQPPDAQRLAEGLGFRGKRWKTLETGCANELELHFLDPRRAAIGLNNVVYFLEKQD